MAAGVTQARVATSEWIKLRTLRSSWITMGVALLLLVGLSLLICGIENARWDDQSPAEMARFNAVRDSLGGVNPAQLAIGVLGVLTAAGEFSTGMIRATFSAVPQRLPVLWGKAGVFAAFTFVITLVAAIIAFFGGQALLGSHGVSISEEHAVRTIVGVALYLTLIGILCVSLGFITRNTAGGITSFVGLLLVIPGLTLLLPGGLGDDIDPYFPGEAGRQIFDHDNTGNGLDPWVGLGVMATWAVAALAAAALLVKRRDV